MKAKKFITKAYNGELGLTMCQDWKSLLEKEFPELVKKEEVFKDGDYVYILRTGFLINSNAKTGAVRRIISITDKNPDTGSSVYSKYISLSGNVVGSFDERSRRCLRRATPEEIKAHLIEECKKRGIWDTADINCIGKTSWRDGKWHEMYVEKADRLWSKYGVVYEQGVFATPIKTMSLSEAEKQLGVKIDITK